MTQPAQSSQREPTIEEMRRDLYGAGWTDSCAGTVWTTPWGTMHRGPHLAWHIWAGTPMCKPKE